MEQEKGERWVNMDQDKKGEMGQCRLGQKVLHLATHRHGGGEMGQSGLGQRGERWVNTA